MAKRDDIEERLIDFAVRLISLCEALPKRAAANTFVTNCCGVAHRQHRIMVRHEGRKVARILSTNLKLC